VAKKRASAAEAPDADAAGRLAALQAQTATPYLVLSGKVRPGQTSDARSGYGTAEQSAAALTPMLGGGQTPLTGARKVEAMLGLGGGGGGGGGGRSMAPPAPRRKP
jgi:U4/U6.U5 tri-snRNP-associated protein 1